MCEVEKSNCNLCGVEIDKYQSSFTKGKLYYSKTKINKYCSQTCSKKARKQRKEVECEHCLKKFESVLSKDRRFCSRECMWDFEKKHQERNYEHLKKAAEERLSVHIEYKPIPCEVCNEIFIPKSAKGKTCSEKCKWKKSQPQHKKARKKRIYERKALLLNKFDNKCSICGYNKCSRSLTFHHIDETTKEFTLDAGNLFRFTLEKILLESEKCQLLCQNCHARHHETDRENNIGKRYIQRREKYVKRKKELIQDFGGCCQFCGHKDDGVQSLTFHHTDKTTKKFPLDCTAFIRLSDVEIQEESIKCQLLCFNCHMEQEDRERITKEGSDALQIEYSEDENWSLLLPIGPYLFLGESI